MKTEKETLLVQLVERRFPKPDVVGSSPTGRERRKNTILSTSFLFELFFQFFISFFTSNIWIKKFFAQNNSCLFFTGIFKKTSNILTFFPLVGI